MSQNFCLKGVHLSQILIWFRRRIWWFDPQKAHNCDICLTRDKSAYYHWSNVPLKQLCAPRHGGRGGKNNGPGSTVQWHFVSLVHRLMLPPYFSFVKALHILMIRQENFLKINTQIKLTIQTQKHRSDIWPLGETILALNDWIFSLLLFFGFKRLLC